MKADLLYANCNQICALALTELGEHCMLHYG